MIVKIIFQDGSYHLTEKEFAWEYEEDSDYQETVVPSEEELAEYLESVK